MGGGGLKNFIFTPVFSGEKKKLYFHRRFFGGGGGK